MAKSIYLKLPALATFLSLRSLLLSAMHESAYMPPVAI